MTARERNRAKYRERREKGLCVSCGGKTYGHSRCPACRKRYNLAMPKSVDGFYFDCAMISKAGTSHVCAALNVRPCPEECKFYKNKEQLDEERIKAKERWRRIGFVKRGDYE